MEQSFAEGKNASETSHRNIRGNFGKSRGKPVSAALAIEQEYREIVPRVLRQERRTAKVIALFAGTTPRAVENWRDGTNGPQVPHFIALAREIPELKAKVLEWLEADNGGGDDPARLAQDIAQFLMARGTK